MIQVLRFVKIILRDSGINKVNLSVVLWGMAIALFINWNAPVRQKLNGLWLTFLLVANYFAIVATFHQRQRHKKFEAEWREVKARAEHAKLQGDYESLKCHVEAMDQLLEDNFGVVAQKKVD